nr:MAG TPA: hypothetical protein [Crassvirales sp.]
MITSWVITLTSSVLLGAKVINIIYISKYLSKIFMVYIIFFLIFFFFSSFYSTPPP